MATLEIPRRQVLPQGRPTQQPRPLPRSGIALQRALAGMQRSVAALDERLHAAERTIEAKAAASRVRIRFTDAYDALKRDPEVTNLRQVALDTLRQIVEEETDGLDPDTANLASEALSSYGIQVFAQAVNDEAARRVESAKAQFAVVRREAVQRFLTGDTAQRQAALFDVHSALQQMVDSQIITREEAVREMQSFQDDAMSGQVLSVVRSDPERAIELLDSPEAKFLSPKLRGTLMDRAFRALETKQRAEDMELRRRQAEEERQRKRAREETHDQLLRAVLESPESIDRETLLSAELDPVDRRQLVEIHEELLTRGGEGSPDRMPDLRVRALTGELDTGDVISLLQQGELNSEQGQELLQVIAEGPAVTRSNEYKAAAQFISAIVGAPPGGGTISMVSAQTLAVAMAEFRARVIAASQVGEPVDLMELAREVVSRATLALQPMIEPRYDTEQQATDAWMRGELSDDEYKLEVWMHQLIRHGGSSNGPG